MQAHAHIAQPPNMLYMNLLGKLLGVSGMRSASFVIMATYSPGKGTPDASHPDAGLQFYQRVIVSRVCNFLDSYSMNKNLNNVRTKQGAVTDQK